MLPVIFMILREISEHPTVGIAFSAHSSCFSANLEEFWYGLNEERGVVELELMKMIPLAAYDRHDRLSRLSDTYLR